MDVLVGYAVLIRFSLEFVFTYITFEFLSAKYIKFHIILLDIMSFLYYILILVDVMQYD